VVEDVSADLFGERDGFSNVEEFVVAGFGVDAFLKACEHVADGGLWGAVGEVVVGVCFLGVC